MPSGPYSGRTFTADELQEIRYASLLHDFGKVGVRENVLVKANKLYPHELVQVEGRFDLIRRTLELESAKRRIEILTPSGGARATEALTTEDQRLSTEIQELDRLRAFVRACNQPQRPRRRGLREGSRIC